MKRRADDGVQAQGGAPDGKGPKVAEKWRGISPLYRYDRQIPRSGTIENLGSALALALEKRRAKSKAKQALPHLGNALPDEELDREAMAEHQRDEDELRREFIKSRRVMSWRVNRKGPY